MSRSAPPRSCTTRRCRSLSRRRCSARREATSPRRAPSRCAPVRRQDARPRISASSRSRPAWTTCGGDRLTSRWRRSPSCSTASTPHACTDTRHRCVQRSHPRLSPWQARPRLPPHARPDLRRRRLRRLGPQVPRQRARALLARLPRSVHEEHAGETLAPRLWHAGGATTQARSRSACVLQVEVSPADLDAFVPDLVIINAGGFPANRYVDGVSSSCTVDLHLGRYSKRFNRTQVGAPQPQPAPRALGPRQPQAPANTRSAGVCSRSRRRRWSSWARSTRAR